MGVGGVCLRHGDRGSEEGIPDGGEGPFGRTGHESLRRLAEGPDSGNARALASRGGCLLEACLIMTAGEVLDRIKKNIGIPWNDRTYRDTFKIGGPDTEVKGIATTFLCTLDVLQRAHAAGLNMVIPHEDTFWNDRDDITGLADDPIYKYKTDFCAKNNMVVWRIHDHAHGHRPDFIWVGLARAMGWGEHEGSVGAHTFSIPQTTLGELAAEIQRKMGIRAFRIVGDPKIKVSTISVGLGYNMPRLTSAVDVTIGGENPETDGS